MNKRKIELILLISVVLVFILLTGFDSKRSIAEKLMTERTSIIYALQQREITGRAACEKLAEIETEEILKLDQEFVQNYYASESCKLTNMYIKDMCRTKKKSGYEVYKASIEWQFNNSIYEKMDCVIVLKDTGKEYKLSKIIIK